MLDQILTKVQRPLTTNRNGSYLHQVREYVAASELIESLKLSRYLKRTWLDTLVKIRGENIRLSGAGPVFRRMKDIEKALEYYERILNMPVRLKTGTETLPTRVEGSSDVLSLQTRRFL